MCVCACVCVCVHVHMCVAMLQISLQDIGCDDSNPSRSDLTKLLTGLDISEKGLSALNLQLGGEADDHDGPSGLKTHSSR